MIPVASKASMRNAQGVPIPELAEHNHADNRAGVSATRPALQTDRDVPTPSIDETLSESSTETRHGVLMFVRDDLSV